MDFVEVDPAQTTLTVYFLGKGPQRVTTHNVAIEGGRTAKDAVRVLAIDMQPNPDPRLDDRMLVHVDKPGDFSTYTLRLTGLDKIDPRYDRVEFSFKVDCPSDIDCAATPPCPPPSYPRPAIDYLAKDYATFRELIFDRLSLIAPDWKERHVPDLGVTLVELLAYTGDYLSYYQDAVQTEAYLNTARRRPSVRRHARLVDYTLSEGCNARTFVAIETERNLALDAGEIFFVTGLNGALLLGDKAAVPEKQLGGLAADAYDVFEPMQKGGTIPVWKGNNILRLYTWGNRSCCLLAGSRQATLRGELHETSANETEQCEADQPANSADDAQELKIRLQPGSVIIFEEVKGPKTGSRADANPAHRHPVRLTCVEPSRDPLTGDPIIEIEWGREDALPFDLCLSALTATAECVVAEDISIACGNVVLVDHGRSLPPETLGAVPLGGKHTGCECEGHPSEPTLVPGRYRPRLGRAPLTFRQPLPVDALGLASAAALLRQDPRQARPAIWLDSIPAGSDGEGPLFPWDQVDGKEARLRLWHPATDLIASGPDDRDFAVEMEEDGAAYLLFGNGETGERPRAGEAFRAHYRIGRGPPGNVGAGAVSLLVHRNSDLSNDIRRVRNPLPAVGGAAPEPMAEAKLNAPYAFRFGPTALARAIIADDYAELAGRNAALQRAAARVTWTGSWFEAEVAIDPRASAAGKLDPLLAEVESTLEQYRRIGHDLDARRAIYVPIHLGLSICVKPGYLWEHVKTALLETFSNRALPGGKLGFFHPDRVTFGDDIYLSAVISEAQCVAGVASVQVTQLHRQLQPSNREIEDGYLPLGPFEIAQLDNDPNYPDHGRLAIEQAKGG